MVSFVSRKTPQSTARVPGYHDFAKLDGISTAAAVVLAADYERLKERIGQVPPTINLHKWNPSVFKTLFQLGFFDILGHTEGIERELVEDGPTLTMPIVSARNADGLASIDAAFRELGAFIVGRDVDPGRDVSDQLIDILTAMSEGITNVTQHAYPEDHTYDYPQIGKYWVAATAHRDNGTLTVVLYDQGATIPVTYPRITRTEAVMKYLRRALSSQRVFDYENDGTYIRAALRYGGSRTDKPYRGKGFPQMISLLKSMKLGRMSVRSRGGWCVRTPSGRFASGYVGNSLGGTLVEWTVELAPLAASEGS